jgi:hypothetical protein
MAEGSCLMMSELLAQLYAFLVPLALTAIAAILTQIISGAARVAKDRWGIEIEARHREALHSALMSGIQAALGRGLRGQAAIDAAVSYAQRSVPDAMARLRPDTGLLANLAGAKLVDVLKHRTGLEGSSLLDLAGGAQE